MDGGPVSCLVPQPPVCAACGAPSSRRTWQAIDLEERPDLREELADPEWLEWLCDACGAWNPREKPLMIIALSPEAPVILGLPDEAFEHDSPAEPHREM